MIELIEHHPASFAIAGYFCFSAVVGGMPEPDASASLWYRWAFGSLHILAGNLTTAMSARYPTLNLPAGSAVSQRTDTTVVVTPSNG
jgi:hypothetical protein